VSDPSLRERADARFEQALRDRGGRDPRGFYRERLRALKESDGAAYRRAVDYYESTLLPAVAKEDGDPLVEWLEYGRMLAELTAPGKTVQIDPTGLAADYHPPVPTSHLVLHLPESPRLRALVVGIPRALSPSQRAAYDLLVAPAA
jgi:hypothetical protein